MSDYSVGKNEEALETLQQLVEECRTSQAACSQQQEAELLRDLGIVRAGGLNDHDGAVKAFHQAFVLNPGVTLSKLYGTKPVLHAYKEAAQSSQAVQRQGASGSQAAPSQEATSHETAEAAEVAADEREPTGFLLAEAIASYGPFGGFVSPSNFATRLGGDLTIGATPTGGSFALAGRARGGVYLGDGGGGALGNFGGSVLLGALPGKRSQHRFIYVFGGTGLEHLPDPGLTALTFHGLVGGNLGGITLGGGIDFGFSDQYAFLHFGLRVGYGSLL